MKTEELNKIITDNDAVLVYFSGESCGVCKALAPKIEQEIKAYYPKIKQVYISATDFQETAASYSVFTIPTVIVFFDSKEFNRKSRHISVAGFIEELKRPYNLFFDNH